MHTTPTTEGTPYYHDGTKWVAFDDAGGVQIVEGGDGISVSGTTTVIVTANVDDVTVEVNASDDIAVKEDGISTREIAANAVITENILNNNVTLSKLATIADMKLIGNVSGATATPAAVSIVTLIDEGPALTDGNSTIPTEGAVYRYVNTIVTGIGLFQGNWDASTSAFPTVRIDPAGEAIEKGDHWIITAAGTMSGILVNIGDVIYAKTGAPGQTAANWFVLESNRDQATESLLGVAKITSEADMVTLTSDDNIVTPEKFKYGYKYHEMTSVYNTTLVGDTTTIIYAKTHSFDTELVHAQVFDDSNHLIEAEIVITNANIVTVNFNKPLGTGINYKLIVIATNNTI
jgi:hypothetical protein